MQFCGKRAISSASASASARAVPFLTTRFARPIRRASSAPTGRPVRIMSMAWESPDQARQTNRSPVDERDSPSPAENAEDRIFLDHAHVAPDGQLESAGHGVAGYRRNHRLAQAPSSTGPWARPLPARCGSPRLRRRRPPSGLHPHRNSRPCR